jgi:hypothetical protein
MCRLINDFANETEERRSDPTLLAEKFVGLVLAREAEAKRLAPATLMTPPRVLYRRLRVVNHSIPPLLPGSTPRASD